METRRTFRNIARCTVFAGAALLLVGADSCNFALRFLQCALDGKCTDLPEVFSDLLPQPESPPPLLRNAGVPLAASYRAEFGASFAAPTSGLQTSQSVRLVVGAPGDQTEGSATGAVYVYTGPADSVAEPVRLVPSDTTPGARFGAAVAVEQFAPEPVVLVGAPGTPPSGAVYVFESTGSGWVETARLTPDAGDLYTDFGASVAFVASGAASDRLAVVGAPRGADGGHVSVFRRTGAAAWAADSQGGHVPAFQPADVTTEDRFGSCLSSVGGFVAVGAPGRGGYMGAGAAFFFRYDAASGAWTESPTRMEPEGTPSQAGFGKSVAVTFSTGATTPTVVVGAPGGYTNSAHGTVWTFLRGDDGTLTRRRFMSTLRGFGGVVAADPLRASIAVGSPEGYGDPTFAANAYFPVDFQSDAHAGRPLRGEEPWSSSFKFGTALAVRHESSRDEQVVYVGAPGEGNKGRVYRWVLYRGAGPAKRAAPKPEGNRYLAIHADATHPGDGTIQGIVDLPLRPPFRAEVSVGSFDPARREGLAGGSIAFRLDKPGSDPPSFVLLRARFGEAGLEISKEDEYGADVQNLSMPSEWIAELAIESDGSLMQLWARPRGVGEFSFVSNVPEGSDTWNPSIVIEGIAAGSEVGMDTPRLVANGPLADGAPPADSAIDLIYAAIDREMALSSALDDRDLPGALAFADEAKARLTEARSAIALIPAKAATTGPKAARRYVIAATRELAKARKLIERGKSTSQILRKLSKSLAGAGRALAALRT